MPVPIFLVKIINIFHTNISVNGIMRSQLHSMCKVMGQIQSGIVKIHSNYTTYRLGSECAFCLF